MDVNIGVNLMIFPFTRRVSTGEVHSSRVSSLRQKMENEANVVSCGRKE